jgi:hypothetical protein
MGVKRQAGKTEALQMQCQTFSLHFKNIHRDQSYECTPNRANVIETGMMLPVRYRVSPAVTTLCWLQFCRMFGSSASKWCGHHYSTTDRYQSLEEPVASIFRVICIVWIHKLIMAPLSQALHCHFLVTVTRFWSPNRCPHTPWKRMLERIGKFLFLCRENINKMRQI